VTRQRSRLSAAVVLVSLVFVAACDGDKPPDSSTTTPISTSQPVPTNTVPQAPPVKTPLDASSFEADPCKSLTAAQQQHFGLDGGRLSDAAVEGKSCFYSNLDNKSDVVSVTYASKSTNGLSTRYIEYSRGAWDYWIPVDIDGYPGVTYDAVGSGEHDPGLCSFAVGVKDSLFFWATAPDWNGAAKCATVKNVAAAVLGTIKAGR
jgi:hypothetical protein